jgi:glycosyltransferase involved in cell wall biosynthesis
MSQSANHRTLISVAIPTRDRAELLEQCLDSLVGQTLPRDEFEVVVIDDGSVDDTNAVCERFSMDLRLRYQRLAPSGIAAAKNAGLFASNGWIVLFFDDDDTAHPDMLRGHVDAHRRWSEPRLAILGHTAWHPSLDVTPLMEYVTEIGQQLFSYPSLEPGKELDYTHFWGGRASAKRAFLLEHGCFNQDFTFGYEDIELGYRLSKHGFAVVYVPEVVGYAMRPVTYEAFCSRCRRQGQSLFRLSMLHDTEEIRAYCSIARLLRTDGAENQITLLDTSALVPPTANTLSELHALYDRAFRACLADGVRAAAVDAGIDLTLSRTETGAHSVPVFETDSRTDRPVAVAHRPVFVIGSPRSGTSVLAWALNEHSALRALPESDFLYYLFQQNDTLRRVYELTTSRQQHTFLTAEKVRWEEFVAAIGYGVNVLFSSRAAGKRWVDQTPLYTLMGDLLVWMFPDSQFVHILRDGRSVVASMLHFGERMAADPEALEYVEKKMIFAGAAGPLPWTSDPRIAAQTWSRFVGTALDLASAYPGRVILVKNEDALRKPQEELARVLAFLGLSNEESVASFFATRRINSSFVPDGSPPPLPDANPWDTWPSEWRAAFTEEAGAMMARTGYWTSAELASHSRTESHEGPLARDSLT